MARPRGIRPAGSVEGAWRHLTSLGSRVYAIEDSNGNQIRVMDTYRDHGGIMATVYLSRYTHQSPIHYKRSTPDEKDGHSGMSVTVDNEFRDALLDRLGPVAADLFGRDESVAGQALQELANAPSDQLPVERAGNTSAPHAWPTKR